MGFFHFTLEVCFSIVFRVKESSLLLGFNFGLVLYIRVLQIVKDSLVRFVRMLMDIVSLH
jgi:hypothetical protein